MSDQSTCSASRGVGPPLHKRALRVCFLRNGDRHFKGVNMVVSQARFKDISALLQEVTDSLKRHVVLRSAISNFRRTDGSHLRSLSCFSETDIVICCCKNEEIVSVNYSINKDFQRMVDSCQRWRQRRSDSGTLECMKSLDLPEAIQLYIESHIEPVVQNTRTLIYRGKTRASKTKCIVKMVNKQTQSNDCGDTYMEAEVLRQLQSHPNIIELMYTVEDECYMYLVLEYLDCDMQEVIQQLGILSEACARSVMRCTVSALAHMHQLQVIHRDIKPENLRVCFSSGQWNFKMVKVANFGLATHYRGSKLNVRCGTPCYMAPEMIAMLGYDYQVDSWSLGVTLFYMLCGKIPFASACENEKNVYAAIMSGGPTYPKDMKSVMSPEATQLIDGLLVSDPSYRVPIADLGQYQFLAL
ncbi:serine/threonine-protein kinase GG21441 [Drosophila mauritiana]|uniref:Doublecortin-like and CAM kinase-like protein n=1 Tax=Drosophila mauritiana TaxID=7226 RepID=A0A6P8K5Y9_DROMA|nr:serine/threonine-protein kinase GG21441 [Drosophila mauritiana]